MNSEFEIAAKKLMELEGLDWEDVFMILHMNYKCTSKNVDAALEHEFGSKAYEKYSEAYNRH